MGKPDRLREEGYTEEQIAEWYREHGYVPELEQNPETARKNTWSDNGLDPYQPPKVQRDEGWVDGALHEPAVEEVAEEAE